MSNISLTNSVRTCTVDPGWANKMQSDRFLNPSNMICPAWNGVDTTGRPATWNSFWTKNAGCNSALDRVSVENLLRPQYFEYVTLDAAGLQGAGSCKPFQLNLNASCAKNTLENAHKQTGQFGMVTDFTQNIKPNCVSCMATSRNFPYNDTLRENQFVQQSAKMVNNKKNAGMY